MSHAQPISCLLYMFTALLCLATPHLTYAQDTTSDTLSPMEQRRLRSLQSQITDALKNKDYTTTLQLIDKAQELTSPHTFLLQRAEALEGLAQYRAAQALYQRHIDLFPDDPQTPALKVKVQDLEHRHNALSPKHTSGSLQITSEPVGAYVSFTNMNGRLKGSTPTVDIPVTRDTTFYLIISKYGYLDEKRTVTVKPGEKRVVHVTLERDSSVMTTLPEDTTNTYSRGAAPWVLWGVGLAGFTGMLLSYNHLTMLSRNPDATTRQMNRTRALFAASTVAAIGGTLGGSILWIIRTPKAPTMQGSRLQFSPTSITLHF